MHVRHCPAKIPQVLRQTLRIDDAEWSLRWSEDLEPAVRDGEALRPELVTALSGALLLHGAGRWRTTLDVASTLFAVAIDEDAREISLGSPRFATEQLLCWILRQPSAAPPDLTELVAAWQQASADAAPRLIDSVAAQSGLDAVLARTAEVWPTLVARVGAEAARLHSAISRHNPSLSERLSQAGLEACARSGVLRVDLLRVVAALPALEHDTSGSEVTRLLAESLTGMVDASARLRAGSEHEGEESDQPLPRGLELLGRCLVALIAGGPASWVAGLTRKSVRQLARFFIAGEDVAAAQPTLARLRATGRDATLDQLGELVVSESEAEQYAERVLALLEGVAKANGAVRNDADLPRAHVSVKTSALCSDFNGDDPDGTWQRVGPRLVRILCRAQALGACIQLDAEHRSVRDLNLEMLRRALIGTPELQSWRDVGIVVQAYLRDSPQHFSEVVELARQRGVVMPVRLVKGAYWDAETTEAAAQDFLAPQWLNKAETDAAFELLTLRALEAADAVQLCIGSHNVRDHVFAHAARELVYPDAPRLEHQVLHQSYEALSRALAAAGMVVRHYVPVGSLLVGMAYLVRRILENSSQVGVLTLARQGTPLAELLRMPGDVLDDALPRRDDLNQAEPPDAMPPFRNVAPARLYLPPHRAALDRALAELRCLQWLPDQRTVARHGPREACPSPSDPRRSLAETRQCVQPDVRPAVARAMASAWLYRPAADRAVPLLRAAERLRTQRMDVAALVAAEAGKARAEALADVDEAIDFLQFYARQALDLRPEQQPLGIVAVIAPWNFPLAIPAGMVAGALAAGNAVLLKSAEETTLCAEILVGVLRDAGVPEDAIQHLPGEGLEVGGVLLSHPLVCGGMFTGSAEVGQSVWVRMLRKAHGRALNRVVAEMGGKNAILVTATADLDEAVSGCLVSAFGHAGQKCSAASRILVDQRVMRAFAGRFAEAAGELRVGKAEIPGTRVNPVIREAERDRLREAAQTAAAEVTALGGRVLVDRSQEQVEAAWTVGPVVLEFANSRIPQESLARRELFGPIVHLIPYEDLGHAVRLANQTPFALTGGIFAQSDADITYLTAHLRCGNLYVNRAITGARVAIEPFGGFGLSGTGPKAGGADYVAAMTLLPTVRAPLDEETLNLIENRTSRPGTRADIPDDASLDDVLLAGLAATLRQQPEPTRAIPGQQTWQTWSLPRGKVLVLAGHSRPLPGTLGHAQAAWQMGNDVEVLTMSTAAFATWHHLSRYPVELVRERRRLEEVLCGPEWATIVLDGDATDWAAISDWVMQIPQDATQLRNIVLGASPLPPLGDLLKQHGHARTIARQTMRHGAALVV